MDGPDGRELTIIPRTALAAQASNQPGWCLGTDEDQSVGMTDEGEVGAYRVCPISHWSF